MYSARTLRTVELLTISAIHSRGRGSLRSAAVRLRLLRRETILRAPLAERLFSAEDADRLRLCLQADPAVTENVPVSRARSSPEGAPE
jgi:hypothetical protein